MAISEMSVDELFLRLAEEQWVDSSFLRYITAHGIDGAALVELTKEDLRDDFGITKLGQIKHILRQIRRLHGQAPPAASPEQRGATPDNQPAQPYFNTPTVKPRAQPVQRFQAATAAVLNRLPEPSEDIDDEPPPLKGLLPPPPATPPPADLSLHSLTFTPIIATEAEPGDEGAPDRARTPVLPDITAHRLTPADLRRSAPSVSGSSTSFRSLSPMLQASQLDLDAARKRGRPKRFREERERDEMFEAGQLAAPKFVPGLLEAERRVTAWRQLFAAWSGDTRLGMVPAREVQQVIDCFTVDGTALAANAPQLPALDSGLLESECLDLSEFLDFVTLRTSHLWPTIFDDLVAYFYVAIGDQSAKREAARRFKLLCDLYESWCGDERDELPVADVREALAMFNRWSADEGDTWIVFDLARIALPAQPTVDRVDFEALLRAATAKFNGEDFDRLYFKLIRCVDNQRDAQRAPQERNRQSLTPEKLESLLRKANPLQPVIIYGTSSDPTKALEVYAKRKGAKLQGCVVSSPEAEERALRLIATQGIKRGAWVYCIVASGYAGTDDFLRGVAREVTTKERWMVHETFTLYLSLAVRTLLHLPRLLALDAIPVPLDA